MGNGYLRRWLYLSSAACLYLLHAALLTGSLAISSLIFNLAITTLAIPPVVLAGQALPFLGILNSISVATAAVASVPLWWLVNRIGFRQALAASAILQASNAFVLAFLPTPIPLLIGASLTGVAAVLFQVSSAPFMMQHSDDTTRDHLFSANLGINLGVAGLGSLIGGSLPALFGQLLTVSAENIQAYQLTFAVSGAGLFLSLLPLLFISPSSPPTFAPYAPTRRVWRKVFGRPVHPVGAQRAAPLQDAPDTSALHRLVTKTFRHTPSLSSQPPTSDPRLPISDLWRMLLRHRIAVLSLLVSPLLISCGAALLIPYLNLFFKARFDIDDSTLGLIFAARDVTTGLAALLGPVISVRIGKIHTIVLVQALSLPLLIMMGFVPLLWVAVAASLLRGGLFNMASPLYDAFAMERTEEPLRPAVIGMINGAFSLGYIAAPLISTTVQARYGFAPLFVATLTCYTMALTANYLLFVRGKR